MTTPLNEEKKKRQALLVASSIGLGIAITTLFWAVYHRKQVDKLESKIFKLEGWR